MDGEGYKTPVYSHKEIDSGYMKVYNGAMYKLAKIQGCPRNLIEYLAIKMDKDNIVQLNGYNRDRFIEDLKKNGGVPYTDRTIKEAISSLKKIEMLICIEKGLYQVNPEFYFKGNSEPLRLKMIKANIKKGIGRK